MKEKTSSKILVQYLNYKPSIDFQNTTNLLNQIRRNVIDNIRSLEGPTQIPSLCPILFFIALPTTGCLHNLSDVEYEDLYLAPDVNNILHDIYHEVYTHIINNKLVNGGVSKKVEDLLEELRGVWGEWLKFYKKNCIVPNANCLQYCFDDLTRDLSKKIKVFENLLGELKKLSPPKIRSMVENIEKLIGYRNKRKEAFENIKELFIKKIPGSDTSQKKKNQFNDSIIKKIKDGIKSHPKYNESDISEEEVYKNWYGLIKSIEEKDDPNPKEILSNIIKVFCDLAQEIESSRAFKELNENSEREFIIRNDISAINLNDLVQSFKEYDPWAKIDMNIIEKMEKGELLDEDIKGLEDSVKNYGNEEDLRIIKDIKDKHVSNDTSKSLKSFKKMITFPLYYVLDHFEKFFYGESEKKQVDYILYFPLRVFPCSGMIMGQAVTINVDRPNLASHIHALENYEGRISQAVILDVFNAIHNDAIHKRNNHPLTTVGRRLFRMMSAVSIITMDDEIRYAASIIDRILHVGDDSSEYCLEYEYEKDKSAEKRLKDILCSFYIMQDQDEKEQKCNKLKERLIENIKIDNLLCETEKKESIEKGVSWKLLDEKDLDSYFCFNEYAKEKKLGEEISGLLVIIGEEVIQSILLRKNEDINKPNYGFLIVFHKPFRVIEPACSEIAVFIANCLAYAFRYKEDINTTVKIELFRKIIPNLKKSLEKIEINENRIKEGLIECLSDKGESIINIFNYLINERKKLQGSIQEIKVNDLPDLEKLHELENKIEKFKIGDFLTINPTNREKIIRYAEVIKNYNSNWRNVIKEIKNFIETNIGY